MEKVQQYLLKYPGNALDFNLDCASFVIGGDESVAGCTDDSACNYNADATENDGRTALMIACGNGHELCARALLEAGAAVDSATNKGATTLKISCQNGHEHNCER